MIAEQLEAALRRKGWSISTAADKSGVNRSFLSRLVNGQDPPRSRSGHQTAEHDDRYRRLAEALELDGFVESVARIQQGQSALPTAFSALRRRYEGFSRLIAKNQPLRHRPDLLRLMNDCLAKSLSPAQAEKLNREIRTNLPKTPRTPPAEAQQPYIAHDYLGFPSNLRSPSYLSPRAQTCRDIGYALIDAGHPDDKCLHACIEIAMLFYDLALLDHS